jgi:deoxyribodipyrimidine photolyase-related protein
MIRLCLLYLGDQLSKSLSVLSEINRQADVVLMCEVKEEATYVSHHTKKIAFCSLPCVIK